MYDAVTPVNGGVEGVGDGKVAPVEYFEVVFGGAVEAAEEEGLVHFTGCGVHLEAFVEEFFDYPRGEEAAAARDANWVFLGEQ